MALAEETPLFTVKRVSLDQPGVGKQPIEMPVDVLLGLPAYVISQEQLFLAAFNLPKILTSLLQSDSDTMQVISPHIWAPGLDDQALTAFSEEPLKNVNLKPIYQSSRLRAEAFPGLEPVKPGRPNNYEIVHFYGDLTPQDGLTFEKPAKITIGVDSKGTMQPSAFTLEDSLKRAQTRLMIFDLLDSSSLTGSRKLAEDLSRNLGLAVLIVHAGTAEVREKYFTDVYTNILNNRPLVEAVTPKAELLPISVDLTYPEGDEDLLTFDRWMNQMARQVKQLKVRAQRINNFQDTINMKSAFLHQSQIQRLSGGVTSMRINNSLSSLTQIKKDLAYARNQPWHAVSSGALELPIIDHILDKVDRVIRLADEQASQPEIIQQELKNAPRVLNANFSRDDGRTLEEHDTLLAGREYSLLVEIGPKWVEQITLVTGSEAFPEEALPPGPEGYVVNVVFVSEDFIPHISEAQIWLPAKSGSSFPYANGRKADKRGPTVVKLITTEIPESEKGQVKLACGRLCLYHENNLLQSARVNIGISEKDGMKWEGRNEIFVDYALTGSFCEADKQLGKRAVAISRGNEQSKTSFSVNITLNDDGAGGHRFVTRYRGSSVEQVNNYPVFFKHYDPVVGKEALYNFRTELLNCIDPSKKLYYTNPLEKFKADLLALARVGSSLRNYFFSDLVVDKLAPGWERILLYKILAEATVIQISRTAPATYVFPWALVYDMGVSPNLPKNQYQYCKVLKEWKIRGEGPNTTIERDGPPANACPHQESHDENCICPYGFWGYKHIIEQPLSVWLSDKKMYSIPAAQKVLVGPDAILSIGRTTDRKLEQDALKAHLRELKGMEKVRFDPNPPAEDRDKVRDMLNAPQIVYFMCHGEGVGGKTYISIGDRDGLPSHQITSDDIGNWRTSPKKPLNSNEWIKRRPLVFMNGCHTADIRPGLALSLVSSFSDLYAGAVIGTEVSILAESAYLAAQSIMKRLLCPDKLGQNELGEAVRGMRWDLLNRGDLSGLAYTAYGLANLKVVFEN